MSIQIQKVTDKSFRKYGRILTGEYDVAELMTAMEKTECPDDAVIYIPSDKEIEKLPVMKAFTDSLYGGLPIQIGYCNGNNHLLNAVEYHRSSEVNVACTDLILLIGSEQDIEDDYTYDTSKIEAFLLPKDTNLDLEVKPEGAKEDPLLVARNKWLIAHEDAKIEGAFNGLKGENISVE